MLEDLATVMWKERRELAGRNPTRRDKIIAWVFPLLSLGFLALIPPLMVGASWVTSPFSVSLSVFVPLMVIGMTIADSFAGERERHTLDTLLASRLPDRAILFGKMGAPLVRAMAMTVVLHVVSLAAVNVVHWQGVLVVYSFGMAAMLLALTLLLGLFAASLGVLVSLRAPTVQQATQTMMVALLAPVMVLSFIGLTLAHVVPDSWRLAFKRFLETHVATAGFDQVLLAILAVILVVDLGLILTAMARFQRSRLYES